MWLAQALFIFTSFIWASQMKKVIKNGTMLVWIVLIIIWFYKISRQEIFEVTSCKELLMEMGLQVQLSISRHHLFVSNRFSIIIWKSLPRNIFHIIYEKYFFNHCVKSVRIRSFLVRTFPHLDWITKDTRYLSVFSPNAGKHGPKKLQIQTLFAQWT